MAGEFGGGRHMVSPDGVRRGAARIHDKADYDPLDPVPEGLSYGVAPSREPERKGGVPVVAVVAAAVIVVLVVIALVVMR